MPASAQHYPLRLTQAQRKVVAEIVPEIAGRLKLEEPDQRTMRFTVEELKIIQEKAAAEERNASTGMKRTSLRHVNDLTTQAIDHSQGIGAIAASDAFTSSRSPSRMLALPFGGASRSRTAPSTSSTSTSRRQWAGPIHICMISTSGSSVTAIRC